ncbi:hypothetical protein DFH09DRAFT_1499064 [Mycena vulgaris]|nr:hypothetical protein DFH09DRAFT_1499064 [Mycena vulgaris]
MNSHLAVHRLPHDILHALFILCNEQALHSDVNNFSVILSHVCSSWRASALANPRIWDTINTHSPTSPPQQMQLRAYLERSQGMELHVTVAIKRESEPSLIATPAFALLAAYAHKVRTLCLMCTDAGQFPALLGCLAADMPLLQTVFMAATPGKEKGREKFLVRCAPRLDQRRSQDVVPFRLPMLADTGVRWSTWGTSNITHLHMKGLPREARPSMESLWHILTGCYSTLEMFNFEGYAPMWDDENSVLQPVVLPMLWEVNLFFVDDLAPLAALLVAPGLERLTISNGKRCVNPYPLEDEVNFVDCDTPRLLEHFGAGGIALRDLFLYGLSGCPRSTIDHFFASLPNVDRIILFEPDETFQAAFFQPECRYRVLHDALFPRLSHISVTTTLPSDLGRFLLRHKTLPVMPLQSLYITHDQHCAAYEPARSILGMILDVCVTETGLQVQCVGGCSVHDEAE